MVVTLLGMTKLVSPVQFEKAFSPMEKTPLGMLILVKPEQLVNAPSPMVLTLAGMVMLVSLSHQAKA